MRAQGDGCEMGICGFGNGEAQWYRKENAGVRDGKLVITAKAEPYAGNIYTSSKASHHKSDRLRSTDYRSSRS